MLLLLLLHLQLKGSSEAVSQWQPGEHVINIGQRQRERIAYFESSRYDLVQQISVCFSTCGRTNDGRTNRNSTDLNVANLSTSWEISNRLTFYIQQ